MADEGGGEGAQNPQSGDDGSQKPFKTFASEEEFNSVKDKMFRSGYNEARSKDLQKLSEVTGDEFTDFDQVIGKISSYKEKISEQVSDPTATPEYKELQDNNKALKSQLTELQEAKSKVERQYDVDQQVGQGMMKVKESHKLNIPESDVRDLFNARYRTDEKGGRLIAKTRDDTLGDWKAVTDENGNYKPLSEVFADFARNYATPKAEGTGGESGGAGSSSGKVKHSEYQAALNEGNHDRAAKLFERGQKNGWENDLMEQLG